MVILLANGCKKTSFVRRHSLFQLQASLSIAAAHCEGVGFTIYDTMSHDRIPSIEKFE